jgi:hypothetical protein
MTDVDQRISVTGLLADREMQVRARCGASPRTANNVPRDSSEAAPQTAETSRLEWRIFAASTFLTAPLRGGLEIS